MGVPTLRLRADYLAIVHDRDRRDHPDRVPLADRWIRSTRRGPNGLNGFATTFYDLSPFDNSKRYLGLWLGNQMWSCSSAG